MKYCMDLQEIHSVKELHDFLQEQMDLPDYYGRNLDALYDLLSERKDLEEISFINCNEGDKELIEYVGRLKNMLGDLLEEK